MCELRSTLAIRCLPVNVEFWPRAARWGTIRAADRWPSQGRLLDRSEALSARADRCAPRRVSDASWIPRRHRT